MLCNEDANRHGAVNRMKLRDAITRCDKSIDAFILVGGRVLKHDADLASAAKRGVKLRFLFPNPSSRWFISHIESNGVSVNEYADRVKHNASAAQSLGGTVEVRMHDLPVHCWFAALDGRIIFTKPIAFFSHAPLHVFTDQTTVSRFSDNFDRAWSRRPGLTNARGTCFLSYSRIDKEIAKRIRGILIRNGIGCWVDVDNIPKGANWDLEIERAIEGSSHILLFDAGRH